jgi:hypothetical protein
MFFCKADHHTPKNSQTNSILGFLRNSANLPAYKSPSRAHAVLFDLAQSFLPLVCYLSETFSTIRRLFMEQQSSLLAVFRCFPALGRL